MRPISDIRRDNIRQLLADKGGVTKAARLMGYANPSFLSQKFGPRPTRPADETTARKMESIYELAPGTLDIDLQDPMGARYPAPDRAYSQPAYGQAPAAYNQPPAYTHQPAPHTYAQPHALPAGELLGLIRDVIDPINAMLAQELVAPDSTQMSRLLAMAFEDHAAGRGLSRTAQIIQLLKSSR